MPAIPMNIALMIYLTVCKLSTVLPQLPILIVMSLFFGSRSVSYPIWGWGTNSFDLYHVLVLVYLLLDGIHKMILEYRLRVYNNLISSPMLSAWLVPGTVISTDKKFDLALCILCLMLSAVKGTISYSQAQYFTQDFLYRIIFFAEFSISCLIIISEIMMLIFIYQRLESKIVSIEIGVDVESDPLLHIGRGMCRCLFHVVDHQEVNSVF